MSNEILLILHWAAVLLRIRFLKVFNVKLLENGLIGGREGDIELKLTALNWVGFRGSTLKDWVQDHIENNKKATIT